MSNAKLEVLTPHNSQLIIIDHQPQMAFGVQSMDRQAMKNNVIGLARAAKIFNIPTTITTVETQGFSGYTYPELLDVFPGMKVLERMAGHASGPYHLPAIDVVMPGDRQDATRRKTRRHMRMQPLAHRIRRTYLRISGPSRRSRANLRAPGKRRPAGLRSRQWTGPDMGNWDDGGNKARAG